MLTFIRILLLLILLSCIQFYKIDTVDIFDSSTIKNKRKNWISQCRMGPTEKKRNDCLLSNYIVAIVAVVVVALGQFNFVGVWQTGRNKTNCAPNYLFDTYNNRICGRGCHAAAGLEIESIKAPRTYMYTYKYVCNCCKWRWPQLLLFSPHNAI